MKCVLSVCLAATICTGIALQSAVRQSVAQAHAMQRGISVEMAAANHARAWPQADDTDAWVVTIDSTGKLYFGIDPMSPQELEKRMIQHPRRRDQKVYIKADARAPYSDVGKALDAASEAELVEPVLLVKGPDRAARPGSLVPPQGFDVSVGSATSSGTVATVVELIFAGQQTPLVKINNDEIPRSALEETLNRRFQKGDDQVVLLKADARLPFAEVVQVIDSCRGAKARVYLAEPEL
jgi:biopolymer transport protein ExbD